VRLVCDPRRQRHAKVLAQRGETSVIDLCRVALLRAEADDHVAFVDVGFVAALADRHRNAAARAEQRRSADAVIVVTWDAELRRPSAFLWRRRTFRVERVVRTWVLTSGWWSEETETSRHYWRVRADGRLFDLSFDRIAKVWRLEHVLN